MAYDCINGWEDLIEALGLDLSAEGIDPDDAQDVATLALDRIAELQRAETAARAMLVALKQCESALYGLGDDHRIDSAWANAGAAIAAAEAAGIKAEG